MTYEYKVIPAPIQMKRSKGAKTAGERLAIEVQDSINNLAADGWEYLRSDTMTVMDKPSRFSKAIEVIETVLIFRREAVLSTAGMKKAKMGDISDITSLPSEDVALSRRTSTADVMPSLGGAQRE